MCAGDKLDTEIKRNNSEESERKLLRSVANEPERNGVGIVIPKELKDIVTSVSRRNDRAII